jgi:hypothetical protein
MTTFSDETNSIESNVPDWDELPCVQYGFPVDEGPVRTPKLRTVFEPIPDGAITVSPIYILARGTYEKQRHRDDPYRVGDGYNSRATELQDEAEDNGTVLYPIHVESDELNEEGGDVLMDWLREFVVEWLGVPFESCQKYFSGNRSIHVHVPRFVAGEQQRERLKQLAEEYCEETGAKLDCGLYYRKRLFRLPGVTHEKTGVPKIAFEGEWDDARLSEQVREGTTEPPETYADVLQQVFGSQLTLADPASDQRFVESAENAFDRVDAESILAFESSEQAIDTPLVEQRLPPDDSKAVPYWSQYWAKEFSPYAHADGGSRSVAALRVKDGAFAREDKRDGATMIPAYFYGAVGASSEYTKHNEHAPLQLSARDYEKWNFQPGDTVVIIGGKSRYSKLCAVVPCHARVVGQILTSAEGGRDAALGYLNANGYDVGTADTSTSSTARQSNSAEQSTSTEAVEIWPARTPPQTEAEALQLQAEQEGIESLGHKERIKVACRHLQYGWQPTWDWFQEQFGSQFKPQVTWRQLNSIVAGGYEEYDDIEVPAKPP